MFAAAFFAVVLVVVKDETFKYQNVFLTWGYWDIDVN